MTEVGTEVGEEASGLLKVKQVAKKLGVSEPTVWRLIRSKELESLIVGARSRRVSPEAVEAYKAKRAAVEAAASAA